ncbi:S41 family peptidase [Flectobacillus rivi]|uniref:S41 family peptidase n=1 Tax=Flectobacillus rivi TaxID=2984209 RepID=A0ABT6Z216_9BACT|nr:S41 family peptidase [Flectobacillus rivi]MDI9875176.1 S41 family peptidase [Flectobacillus rivi]
MNSMLRFNIIKFITVVSISLLVFTACSKKEDSTVTPTDNTQQINQWIYDTMSDAYYWYDQLPAISTLSLTDASDSFFEKLVYQRSTVDRFSMVTDDVDELEKEFNGVSKVFGIRYMLGYLDNTQTNVGLVLTQVITGSPAAVVGLNRGDIIVKINGQNITSSNFSSLMGNETVTFTLGSITNGSIAATSNTVSVTKTEVTENPVAFSSIVQKTSANKTIGYLVYTQFVPGLDSGDTLKYDNQLRSIFADFKAAGVNELVLDLRFNPGGYISSATTLASLIVNNLTTNKVFFKDQYNSKYQTYFAKQYGSNIFNNYFSIEKNNIGNNLNRVFVLTSNGTASSSELVINGLKPYMQVITIGEHTYGKNLFGTLVADDQKRWKWGIYMMLGITQNANGESDYGNINGIAPTYAVDDNVLPLQPLGNDYEPLFNKALTVMGVSVPNTNGARQNAGILLNYTSHENYADNPMRNEKFMIKNYLPKLINK